MNWLPGDGHGVRYRVELQIADDDGGLFGGTSCTTQHRA